MGSAERLPLSGRQPDSAAGSPEARPPLVRAELEKILASSGFRNADRMARFLRFVVERTLDGKLDDLKEYSIGMEVFDRGASFDPRLDPSRRYCRPWTRDFVQDISQAYYHRFHQQIQVNSAVRTVKVQKKLRRHNRNAAPAEGDTASSHLAGLTVDLQRRGMTQEQVHWMEHYLFYMKALGLVEPEEERHQWVFHIMVSGRYAEWRETQDIVPVERPEPVTMTADSRAE